MEFHSMLAFEMIIAAGAIMAGDLDAKQRSERGEVFHRGEWRLASAVEETAPPAKFVELRRKAGTNGAARWDLAQWAKLNAKEEYLPQARVAERLGFANLDLNRAFGRSSKNGVWGTAEEFEARARILAEFKAVQRKWTAELKRLSNPPERIPTITEPMAIPIFEREVSSRSDAGAKLVVAQLRSMTHQAATSSLARHAVFGPGEGSRKAAADALLQRSPEYFVPLLLDGIWSVDSWFEIGAGGHPYWFWRDFDGVHIPGYRFDFAQSRARGISSGHMMMPDELLAKFDGVLGVQFGRGGTPVREGDWITFRENGRDQVASFGSFLSERTVRKTEAAIEINEARKLRAHDLLVRVAGKDLGPEVKPWAEWWGRLTDMHFDMESAAPSTSVVDESVSLAIDFASCFRFDTPVWTERGLRPIHEIELGDRVLSKDVRTGELAYKPVFWRTLRPSTEMKEIVAGGSSVHATLGHQFRIEEKGWVKAKELAAGMTARTWNGKAPVEAVKDSPSGRAFNLEVADFGTYFVGKSGMLVHDLSPIRD
jgi:hypothetical protein